MHVEQYPVVADGAGQKDDKTNTPTLYETNSVEHGEHDLLDGENVDAVLTAKMALINDVSVVIDGQPSPVPCNPEWNLTNCSCNLDHRRDRIHLPTLEALLPQRLWIRSRFAYPLDPVHCCYPSRDGVQTEPPNRIDHCGVRWHARGCYFLGVFRRYYRPTLCLQLLAPDFVYLHYYCWSLPLLDHSRVVYLLECIWGRRQPCARYYRLSRVSAE